MFVYPIGNSIFPRRSPFRVCIHSHKNKHKSLLMVSGVKLLFLFSKIVIVSFGRLKNRFYYGLGRNEFDTCIYAEIRLKTSLISVPIGQVHTFDHIYTIISATC